MGTPEPHQAVAPLNSALRFFGPSWATDPAFSQLQVPDPPEGTTCPYCVEVIAPGRRGVRIPHVGLHESIQTYWHVMCFLVSTCGEDVARQAQRESPQLMQEPYPS
jgi:hypothetical protein